MPILNVQVQSIGASGQKPYVYYIQTNDTLAQVTTAGYLNKLSSEGIPLSTDSIAVVSTKASVGAKTSSTGWFGLTQSSGAFPQWSLTSNDSTFALPSGDIFVGNGSGIATAVALSGDATLANTGAMTIANSAITNAKVSATAAIDYSKLATLTSGNILVGSAGNAATSVAMSGDTTIIASGAVTIANSAITNAKVSATAAIDYSKLGTLTSGNILVGSAGNVATSVAMSGDATIIASGALTVGAGAITSSKLSPLTVQYARLTPTLAAFLAMYDTPITLVAAPGANQMIILEQVQVQQTYGSAALASGGVSAIQYDVTAHGAGIIASTTLTAASLFQTASSTYTYNPGVVILPFATTVNKALALSCLTGDFTTGTGSTFIIHVWYRIVASV